MANMTKQRRKIMIFDFLQLVGGVILSVGYIPQIIKLVKTKSAEDFNVKTFVMVWTGVFLMEVYAVNLVVTGSGLMYLVTNTMALVIQGIFVALIFKYKTKKEEQNESNRNSEAH